MAKLLLLEDEAELREELADFLRARGWDVLEAGSVAQSLPLLAQVDMAVCDVMLPDGSGFDVVSCLREHYPACGVVLLTALGTTQNMVAGLQQGADHYLVKPVNLLQLDATLHALARRLLPCSWQLNRAQRQLCAPDGSALDLSVAELQLLSLLVTRQGEAASRRDIVEAFGYDWLDYDQRRLDTLVSRLRQRCKQECGSELPLKTVHREGYALTACVMLA
ncbi:response regulator transcription factor [Craterilacuibacter sinensis]|uniref:Response regulator n=1 Tax=Craterilacuibacter sinensis TaxID=2686017 RepID=A0A845BRZ5_9NEIS|nr:response regulator transcription factor [Craterilacuibacter sinensis]MXR37271.1 response regulator [Craterilacuibacter sinensis]